MGRIYLLVFALMMMLCAQAQAQNQCTFMMVTTMPRIGGSPMGGNWTLVRIAPQQDQAYEEYRRLDGVWQVYVRDPATHKVCVGPQLHVNADTVIVGHAQMMLQTMPAAMVQMATGQSTDRNAPDLHMCSGRVFSTTVAIPQNCTEPLAQQAQIVQVPVAHQGWLPAAKPRLNYQALGQPVGALVQSNVWRPGMSTPVIPPPSGVGLPSSGTPLPSLEQLGYPALPTHQPAPLPPSPVPPMRPEGAQLACTPMPDGSGNFCLSPGPAQLEAAAALTAGAVVMYAGGPYVVIALKGLAPTAPASAPGWTWAYASAAGVWALLMPASSEAARPRLPAPPQPPGGLQLAPGLFLSPRLVAPPRGGLVLPRQ